MKKIILSIVILTMLVMSVSTVFAKGPYKAVGKNPNLIDFNHLWATALDLTTADGKFVQWFHDKQYVCQCTDGMNPDAIASKQSEGWTLWNPSTTDPRYEWCPNHKFIYRMT